MLTKRLAPARFDLYALGTRQAAVRLIAEERSYWSDLDENVVGLVCRDRIDDDFSWVMLVRDRAGRFRAAAVDASIETERKATAQLRLAMADASRKQDLAALGSQGDEPNTPFDLLRIAPGTPPSRLHPYFRELLERPGREPARAVVREIGPWLAPSDPHFVREFQETQFDQRLWELYLWAAMRELGFDVVQLEAPDFECSAPGIAFTIEATTAAPSTMGPLAHHPNPQGPDEMADFLANYMPMKYGSALYAKLTKRNAAGLHYWEREEAKGKPFVLAIADFHKAADQEELGSMTYTQSALWAYLYGRRVEWDVIDGELRVKAAPVGPHSYGGKTIPSGFFDLPGAENVAAVMFSNAGTIAKFDRMGVVAGFGAEKHRYFRMGLRQNPDPNATMGIPFAEDVADPSYKEYWSDELQIFHNPNALIPLPVEWFGGITQHFFENDNLHTLAPEGAVLSSYTMLMQLVPKLSENEESEDG